MSNALKVLLQGRHLHAYSDFIAEYGRCARYLDLPGDTAPPTKAQYYRWVGGQVQNLPRGRHCAVLEAMFPGWTIQQLFGPPRYEAQPFETDGLLSTLPPLVPPTNLSGLWLTCSRFEGEQHHVELATVTATANGLISTNHPPDPRTDSCGPGFLNAIEAAVHGHHVIGRWRKLNDNYYCGMLHFAILPGESLLDGYYTGFLTDTQVIAEPWRWVRVEPRSAASVDLSTVTLSDPSRLRDIVNRRTRYDPPIPLEQIVEPRHA